MMHQLTDDAPVGAGADAGGAPTSNHNNTNSNAASGGESTSKGAAAAASASSAAGSSKKGSKKSSSSAGGKKKSSSRQTHQLPMFLSKTFHMISRCEPDIATWSVQGDSFVIKNVETFASTVLPQYFKHSNFSSFARQLNFYGFRKLKAEPICLADADDQTSSYVSFYHQHFQKDRPDLLNNIKRATKSEQQTREENDSLRMEISQLRQQMATMQAENDRKIAELTYDFNQRFAALNADYQNLLAMVQQHLGNPNDAPLAVNAYPGAELMQSLTQVAGMHLKHSPSIVRPHYTPAADVHTVPSPPMAGEKRSAEGNIAHGNNKMLRM